VRARTASLHGATLEQTQKIVRSRACIPGGLLSTMHGCVVLWLIDCALTVVSTMCAGHRRRCPSFIYTTACDTAHGSMSSRILFLPSGRGAAALSPWRRGATGLAHARAHEEARHGALQKNCYGVRAMCFAWLMLVDLQFVILVSCCLLALSCRGGLRCHVVGYTWGRTINEPATPPRVALLAELSCHGACEMFSSRGSASWRRGLVW